MNHQTGMLATMAIALFVGQASAAPEWTLNTGTTNGTGTDATVTATAWANTGAYGSPTNSQAAGTIAQQTGSGNPFGMVLYGGGLGITNYDACDSVSGNGIPTCTTVNNVKIGDLDDGTQPEHAIDNNQRYEMVRLEFSEAVNLSSIYFGWAKSDADFTLLAFNPAIGSDSSLEGKTWGTLDTGWQKIRDYSPNLTNCDSYGNCKATQAVSTATYSSLWLVGAYNPLGGTANSAYSGSDYFKLASITGTTCPPSSTAPGCGGGGNNIPEPSSLAMLGIGLLGLLRIRKANKTV